MSDSRQKLHIYLRVSSDAQEADGFGLEIQRKGGLAAASQYGLEPVLHEEGSVRIPMIARMYSDLMPRSVPI